MDRALSLSGKSANHDHLQQVDAILTSMTTEMPEVSNTIVLSEHLPAAMQRAKWSVKDFHLLRQVHKG